MRTLFRVCVAASLGVSALVIGAGPAGAELVGGEFVVMHDPSGNRLMGTSSGEKYGQSTAISGDGNTMAVGSYFYDSANLQNIGRVQVYLRNGNSWTQFGGSIVGETTNEDLGFAVSLSDDGTYLAIGSRRTVVSGVTGYGRVQVLKRTASGWTPWGSPIVGAGASDMFGLSVALSSNGQVVAVGTASNFASVYAYDTSTSQFARRGSAITLPGTGDAVDVDLSSDGSRVVLGHANYDAGQLTDAGRVQTYGWSGSSWSQVGSDLVGIDAGDRFGEDVKISGDGSVVVTGASRRDVVGPDNGTARVYRYSSNSWTQVGLEITGTETNEYLGSAVEVSSDGSTVAVAALNTDTVNGGNTGSVRVYSVSNSALTQIGSAVPGLETSSAVGALSFDANGRTLVIGMSSYQGFGAVLPVRRQSGDASLASVSLSSGSVTVAAGVASYSVSVPNTVKSLSVTPRSTSPYATVTHSGANISSGSSFTVSLKTGTNTVSFRVVPETGSAVDYSIVVTRLPHRLKIKKSMSLAAAMRTVDASVPRGAKVRVSLAAASRRVCTASPTVVKALDKTGTCKVVVSVTPKATKKTKKPRTTRTTVTVTVYK